jgi:hypothetical protein
MQTAGTSRPFFSALPRTDLLLFRRQIHEKVGLLQLQQIRVIAVVDAAEEHEGERKD